MVASVMSEEAIIDAGTAKRLIVHRWLYWGVIPIVAALVLTVIAGRSVPPRELSEIQVENVLELFLAIAAGFFLLGFAIDGYALNPERLARVAARLAAAAGEQRATGALETPENPHGAFVRARVLKTASAVSVLGAGIGVAAIGDVLLGGTLGQGMMLIVLGVLYQFYVLSRHGHYYEMINDYARILAPHLESDEEQAEEDSDQDARERALKGDRRSRR